MRIGDEEYQHIVVARNVSFGSPDCKYGNATFHAQMHHKNSFGTSSKPQVGMTLIICLQVNCFGLYLLIGLLFPLLTAISSLGLVG